MSSRVALLCLTAATLAAAAPAKLLAHPAPTVVKTLHHSPVVVKTLHHAPALVKTYQPAPALVKTYHPAPALVKTYHPAPALVKTYHPAPAVVKTVHAPVPPAVVKTVHPGAVVRTLHHAAPAPSVVKTYHHPAPAVVTAVHPAPAVVAAVHPAPAVVPAAAAPAVVHAHAPAVAPLVAQTVPAVVRTEHSAPGGPEAHYNFGYSVNDLTAGNHQTRQETRAGDIVTGSYSVADPDGRIRTVTYTADPVNGFRAKVTYDGQEGPVAVPVVPVSPLLAPAAAVISTRTGRRLEDSEEDSTEEAADVSPEDTSHEVPAGPLDLHTAASANTETAAEDTVLEEQESL